MNIKILNRLTQMFKDSPQLLRDTDAMRHAINGVFNVNINHINYHDMIDVADRIDDAVLSLYFSTVWQPETKKYKYSGLSIIDEVNALNPENVLDVGCGYNEFKGKIHNLVGIDPYNSRADSMVRTLDYKPPNATLYDVVICLGSINFGSADKIYAELEKVVALTKKGGLLIFRVNPGIQHGAFESQWINFFDWDTAFIMNVAQALNCTVKQLRHDIPKNAMNGGRLYFVLEKN